MYPSLAVSYRAHTEQRTSHITQLDITYMYPHFAPQRWHILLREDAGVVPPSGGSSFSTGHNSSLEHAVQRDPKARSARAFIGFESPSMDCSRDNDILYSSYVVYHCLLAFPEAHPRFIFWAPPFFGLYFKFYRLKTTRSFSPKRRPNWGQSVEVICGLVVDAYRRRWCCSSNEGHIATRRQ